MYTQEEEGLIVGDNPSNKGDDSNPISVKDIQDASTQAALQPICMRPVLLPTYTCAVQVVACGHGECCSSSLVAAVELEKKSYVDGFVARLVAGAVYTISKSEQAAST